MSGVIGFNREFNNKSAGLRTNILVCLGATIIALVQNQLAENSLKLALEHKDIANVFIYEQGRLIAQVISGIGFLGAGTIIITKRFVSGLTTAASLWACACLGIAIGLGFYAIAIVGFVLLMLVLTILKRIIRFKQIRHIEVSYYIKDTITKINNYFTENNIDYRITSFKMNDTEEKTNYTTIFKVEISNDECYQQIIDYLITIDKINKIIT
jgi:putative Mg2+ transporter-C (MgtC) family protein